jgi:transcriptional regulator with XRE-family HTH domain
MDEAGLGTIALAEASGIDKETISLWRKGDQKRYTVEKVALVAAELGSTAAEMLGMPSDPEPSVPRSQADEKERSRRAAAEDRGTWPGDREASGARKSGRGGEEVDLGRRELAWAAASS